MAERLHALVGTYTTGTSSRGVYAIGWDARRGAEAIEVLDSLVCEDPSYVVVHPRLPLAYAVNERPTGAGGLTLLALPSAGSRTLANAGQWLLQGELPCHLAFTADARGLLVCHYGSGAVEWLGLDSQGRPNGERRLASHEGRGAHPRRQANAHAHSACVVGADIYVADLGIDAVLRYQQPMPGEKGPWIARARYPLHAGAGPRTLVEAPSAAFLLVSNELDNTISVLRRDAAGHLTEEYYMSALPANFGGRSACAELAVDPYGRYVQVANRGHDSIATFALANDKLAEPSGFAAVGRHPRHFLATPDRGALLVASRDDDGLRVFDMAADGALRLRGEAATPIPAPVCIAWCDWPA